MNSHFSDMFSFECLWVLYNSKNKKILTDICFFLMILSNVLVPYSILVKCLYVFLIQSLELILKQLSKVMIFSAFDVNKM